MWSRGIFHSFYSFRSFALISLKKSWFIVGFPFASLPKFVGSEERQVTDMSFDKEQRQTLQFLGGLRTLAEMMELGLDQQSDARSDQCYSMVRSYFEKVSGPDKALFSAMKPFMMALVDQLHTPNDLKQSGNSVASQTCNELHESTIDCYGLHVNLEKSNSDTMLEDEENLGKCSTRTFNGDCSAIGRGGDNAISPPHDISNTSFHERDPSSSSNVSPPSLSHREEQFCLSPSSPLPRVFDSVYDSQAVANEVSSEVETKANVNEEHYPDITKKMQDINLDDVDSHEQPVNYSLKYPEESGTRSNFSPHQSERNFKMSSSKSKEKINTSRERIYEPYAETDLDNMEEPIDFSRKYHEFSQDNTSSSVRFNGPSFSQPLKDSSKLSCSYEDTIKVFCTEDTPLNFSTSSSLTDLRDIGMSGLQTPNSCFEDCLEKSPDTIHNFKEETYKNGIDARNRLLATVEENEENIKENRTPLPTHEPSAADSKEIAGPKNDGEASIDETPLMFSRSSSLCSLNSFEQQSLHDDRSSVSDFSHLPSGVVSPSDLPDSPLCYTPKMFKVKDAPPAFNYCNSLSPLQSEDESAVPIIGQDVSTLQCSSNDVSNLSHDTITQQRDHPVPQQSAASRWPSLKSDLSHSDENGTTKSIGIEESKRLPDIYEKVKGDNFRPHQKEIDLSEKALIEQFISLGMPMKQSAKGTLNKKLSNNRIGKTTIDNSHLQDSISVERISKHYGSPQHNTVQYLHEMPERSFENVTTSENRRGSDCDTYLETSVTKKCEITPSEKALLKQFILFGMPGNDCNVASPKVQQNIKQTAFTQNSQLSPLQLKSPKYMPPGNMAPGQSTTTLKCFSNNTANMINPSTMMQREDHLVPQQPIACKQLLQEPDLSYSEENIAANKPMEMEESERPSESCERMKQNNCQSNQKEADLSDKTLIQQLISLGMPKKRSEKASTIKNTSSNQIGKSTQTTIHNSLYSHLPTRHSPSKRITNSHRQITLSPNEAMVHSHLQGNVPVQSVPTHYRSPQHNTFRNLHHRHADQTGPCETVSSENKRENDCKEYVETGLKKCEITPSDKALLEQFIFLGMPKNSCQARDPKLQQSKKRMIITQNTQSPPLRLRSPNYASSDNVPQNAVIVNYMPSYDMIPRSQPQSEKVTNSSKITVEAPLQVSSPLREANNLSDSERAVLDEIILFGMPERKSKAR